MSRRRRALSFYKMHSLGNDFMVIDAVTQSVQWDEQKIALWGDRHRGVGFDQLLAIEPPTTGDADFYYRIYNSDGSTAEQCGNGTRCVAMLARQLKLTKKDTLTWQSPAGQIQTVYSNPEQIETTMTCPVLLEEQIPFDASASVGIDESAGYTSYQLQAQVAGQEELQTFSVTPISMGNPHGVIFCDDIFNIDVEKLGGALTQHAAFPQGANIGFCQVIDRQFMRLRVYERGVGETQACGTGACAAVVAAKLHNLVGDKVKVSLPGGKLRITWPDKQRPVTMSGNATLMFRGELQDEG